MKLRALSSDSFNCVTEADDSTFHFEAWNINSANLTYIFDMSPAAWDTEAFTIDDDAARFIGWDIFGNMTANCMHFRHRHEFDGVRTSLFDKLVCSLFDFDPKLVGFIRVPSAAVFDGREMRIMLPFGSKPVEAQISNRHVDDMGSGMQTHVDCAAGVVYFAFNSVSLAEVPSGDGTDMMDLANLVESDFLDAKTGFRSSDKALVPVLASASCVEAGLIEDEVGATVFGCCERYHFGVASLDVKVLHVEEISRHAGYCIRKMCVRAIESSMTCHSYSIKHDKEALLSLFWTIIPWQGWRDDN
jgi:hypothetical protein